LKIELVDDRHTTSFNLAYPLFETIDSTTDHAEVRMAIAVSNSLTPEKGGAPRLAQLLELGTDLLQQSKLRRLRSNSSEFLVDLVQITHEFIDPLAS
jgi:hypothetical protein